MHESGLGEAVLERVLQRAGGRKVLRMRVRVGAGHRVEAGALEDALRAAAAGTVADGAAVEIVIVPIRVLCRDCGGESEADDPWTLCPRCGSADVDTDGGDDLVVEWIELESATPGPGPRTPSG